MTDPLTFLLARHLTTEARRRAPAPMRSAPPAIMERVLELVDGPLVVHLPVHPSSEFTGIAARNGEQPMTPEELAELDAMEDQADPPTDGDDRAH